MSIVIPFQTLVSGDFLEFFFFPLMKKKNNNAIVAMYSPNMYTLLALTGGPTIESLCCGVELCSIFFSIRYRMFSVFQTHCLHMYMQFPNL